MVLTIGSIFVILGGINRIIVPEKINYNGMIIFAIFGVIVNFLAAYFTKEGESINQKAVNLHMLEDVMCWIIVLIGSILMKYTDISIIDSIMSIGVAIYILINAFKNFKEILDLFLEKLPKNISIEEVKKHLNNIKDVIGVHHIHIWSIDGNTNYATLHIVTESKNICELKGKIKDELKNLGISHTTIEIEGKEDKCNEEECNVNSIHIKHLHHH